jgi:hypothetical protein
VLHFKAEVTADPLDDEERRRAVLRFESELLPEFQEQHISEFIAQEFPHGFLPPSKVVRSMAAWNWHLSEPERSQLALAV